MCQRRKQPKGRTPPPAFLRVPRELWVATRINAEGQASYCSLTVGSAGTTGLIVGETFAEAMSAGIADSPPDLPPTTCTRLATVDVAGIALGLGYDHLFVVSGNRGVTIIIAVLLDAAMRGGISHDLLKDGGQS